MNFNRYNARDSYSGNIPPVDPPPIDLDAMFSAYKSKNAFSLKDPFIEYCDTWQEWAEIMDDLDWEHCKDDWFVPEGLILRQTIEFETWIDISD